ncbi:hypothetical protein ABIC47_003531 [Leifsonia sp. 563]|uniref:hypothetical protein n=1 Tax=Leifsonia sp. 563 TaxID=3156412 RepID=UPI003397B94C
MQKLYYAGGHIFLDDDVCDALVRYAQALADVGKSDLVVVPALSDEGLRGETRLLIGPASQLFTAPALDRGADLQDAESTRSMRDKTARLQPSSPVIGRNSDLPEEDFG